MGVLWYGVLVLFVLDELVLAVLLAKRQDFTRKLCNQRQRPYADKRKQRSPVKAGIPNLINNESTLLFAVL